MTTTSAFATQDEKTWIPLAHFSGIFSFVGPLIVLLVQKGKSASIDRETKESLNFQITVALAALALYILGSVLAVVAGVKAGQTGRFRYPLTLRLLK